MAATKGRFTVTDEESMTDDEIREQEAPPTQEERAAAARVLAGSGWATTAEVATRAALPWERAAAALLQLHAEGLLERSFCGDQWQQFLTARALGEVLAAIGTTPTTLAAIEEASHLAPAYLARALALLELQGKIQALPVHYLRAAGER